MNGHSGSGEADRIAASAAALIDAHDEELLRLLRECHEQLDPMPDSVVQRSLFALAVEDIDAEVLRLAEEYRPAAGVRGDAGDEGEQARVVTFDSDSLTIMIRISRHAESVRIDGWLAPPQSCRVELRSGQRTLAAAVDAEGRFVLDAIPRGLAQLVVRLGEALTGSGGPSILTPAIVL
ncbi:carboxypeptidase regulatory-like domain-containing protein [Actinocrinis puniceicyclus]|uniref:Carboxypeptidase regulatory-like domain-containing protein n=1 Tax=Actinocrinis puniceicyclus TaxID=977794 RepID=A0A8J8BD17_9ACTN|nr:hypothetical protein [Actinocrinis puniceicyclus]MBS2965722.1 carboxypeptidase regulatory-like domain-containing protein [Actinocrinis puniceicyclus]